MPVSLDTLLASDSGLRPARLHSSIAHVHATEQDLYSANAQPRTAQAFVCSSPDGDDERIDVVNVHAPSGSGRLKDLQRMALLTSLLQSNSRAVPGRTIGNARFLIGGT